MKDVLLQQTPKHLHLQFSQPYQVLSSAVENGGMVRADHLLNLKVDGEPVVNETPQQSLQSYAQERGWRGVLVGMMTAASMESCRVFSAKYQQVALGVALTLGLSNAGRVGEPAIVVDTVPVAYTPGTINIILVCSAPMAAAAMVEAVQMVTEAKVAALQDAGITSTRSSQLATGTGTDAVAVCCADPGSTQSGAATIDYCGKHLVLGELIGRLVYQAMTDSLAWYKT